VAAVEAMAGNAAAGLQEFTGAWTQPMGWHAVAVTRGKDGCAIRIGGDYAEVAGHPVTVVDTVGAGDAFAAAFLCGLSQNWSAARTADFANRLGAVVASRAGGLPPWSTEDLWQLP
jgi:fructokinase